MTEQLKPCPKCKKKGSVISVHTIFFLHEPLQYYFRCEKCGMSSNYAKTIKEAIEAWNRRANDRRLS